MKQERVFKEKTRLVHRDRLPFINILPQQRRELPSDEKLKELAASMITTGGNKNAVWVIKIDGKKQAEEYANFFFKMYGGDRVNIRPADDGAFYFMIAGHCRMAAYGLVPTKVLPKIKITFHYPMVSENIAYHAVVLQIAENVHNTPPAHVVADSIVAIYNAYEIAFPGEKHSMASIARGIGKLADTVANAMKWRGLPEMIRQKVVEGVLSFGAAIELGRLHLAEFEGEKLFSDDFVRAKMLSVMAQRTSVPTLKKLVDELITHNRDVATGQDFFLEAGMSIAELLESDARHAGGRKIVEFRSMADSLRLYAKVVSENPELLESHMGKLFEGGVREEFLSLLAAFEAAGMMLHKRQKIDDLTRRRAERVALGLKKKLQA